MMKVDVPIQLRSPFSRPSSPSEYLIDVLPAILAIHQMHRAPNLLIFGNRKYRPPSCWRRRCLSRARWLNGRATGAAAAEARGGACARAVFSCRPVLARRTPAACRLSTQPLFLWNVEEFCLTNLPQSEAQDEERQNKTCPRLVLRRRR